MKTNTTRASSSFSRTLATPVLLLLLLVLPTTLQAQFTYASDGSQITITRYDCSGGEVTIPDTINGLPVTRIGNNAFRGCVRLTNVTIGNSVALIEFAAFYGCAKLTSVTIPDSVTLIESGVFLGCSKLTNVTVGNGVTGILCHAFEGCSSLANITIGDNVTFIGQAAFDGCSSLTSVIIPHRVTSIGFYAFSGCTRLRAIEVATSNPAYRSVDGVLLDSSKTTLAQYPSDKADSYTVPDGVTTIGVGAFVGCTRLTNVTIPDSVNTIGEAAFNGCIRLSRVTIGNSIATIGNNAFSESPGLTGVYFRGNAPSAGLSVFYSDDKAILYHLPGATGWTSSFAGRPTALWNPEVQTSDASFGVRTGQFGFGISWANDETVVVEASVDLADRVWIPVGTNTLTGGSSYFSDAQWTNHSIRFYRLRYP